MNVEDIKFKPLEAKDIEVYKPFYGLRDNKTCDSVPIESFIWKDYYQVQVAVVEKDGVDVGIIWQMCDEGKYYSAMPICATEHLKYCFELSVEYFNKILKVPYRISLADEEAVKELKLESDARFKVSEQEDLKDYLYDGDAMRSLAGKKLHKKKNHYNKFIKEYEGRYIYRELVCSDRDEVFRMLAKWRDDKGDDVEEHPDPEVMGVHEILKNCRALDITMGGVYVDDVLEAFTVGSYNKREDMAVIHIEKANANINGIYQFINKTFLCEEFPTAKLINREDDLGIEGLRRAKESYMPIGYARKYLVEQNL